MAVSFPDVVSSFLTTTASDPANNPLSHEVTTGTTLLLVQVAHKASEGAASITWNGNDMTKIVDLNTSSETGDAGGSIWGLISPTPATADVAVTSDSDSWLAWHIKAAVNVHGTTTTNVAAAISNLSLDENTSATSTNVHASGGSEGNKLVFFGVGIGDDMVPATNNASFTELAELATDGGQSSAADGSVYIAEGDAASAITVTWGASDENSGGLFELVAAGGTTFTETHTYTGTGTSSTISKILIDVIALTYAITGPTAFSKSLTVVQTITYSVTGTAVFNRVASFFRSLSYTVTATVQKISTISKALVYTTTGTLITITAIVKIQTDIFTASASVAFSKVFIVLSNLGHDGRAYIMKLARLVRGI